MVIDDLADRDHDCDLLLDQNLVENMSVRYQGKLTEKCIQLLGPQYALLQPQYSQLHKIAKPRRQPLKNLLVFFGGIDHHDLTGLTLAALRNVNISFDSVDVVVSGQSANYNKIKYQVDNSLNMQLHSNLPSLAHLMLKAGFSVGAGGSTNWERLCLGLPTLVVTVAENQKPVNRSLHNMGLIQWIGDVESVELDCIKSAVEKIVSIKKIYDWSEHCMNVCSGDGVNNVIDKLLPVS
jgi:UDP-2,4-diacetamido-2,4,6-trideoxy-beta-L-altropyranose hydrolase